MNPQHAPSALPRPVVAHAADRVPSAAQAIDPLQQLRAIWRYRWQLLGIVMLTVLLTLILVLLATPVYRATATVLIEPKSANIVNVQQVNDESSEFFAEDYRRTQMELLQSRSLALTIADKLQLAKTKEFGYVSGEKVGPLTRLIELLRPTPVPDSKIAAGTADLTPQQKHIVSKLKEAVLVELVPKTQMVQIHVDAADPALSASIANALMDAYIESDVQSKRNVSERASKALTERLEDLRTQLKQSEQKLQDFYEREKLVNVGGARSLDEEDLSDNNRRLREARKKRTDLENVYRIVTRAGDKVETLQEVASIQQEPLVQSTKRTFLEARQASVQAQNRYGEKHPAYIQARKRLEETQMAYFAQLRLAADGIRSDYEVARDTEQSLEAVVGQAKNQIQKLDRKHAELDMLQRDVNSNRELFNNFLTRLKETESTEDLSFSRTRVVDRAAVPVNPFKPRIKLWLLMAAMLGLFLGLIYALLRDYLDDTIEGPAQLEHILNAPVLGVLPLVLGKVSKKISGMAADDPRSPFAEGIRSLRTALLLSDVVYKHKKILITSTVPGEGKTSITLNLALAFSNMERVLVLECDLRKPRIGKALDIPEGSPGLCNLLAGLATLQQCTHRHESGQHDVIPCGQVPPNPSELLASPQFYTLLQGLEQKYDRIFLDSPPCLPVSDALLLSRVVDGMVYVTQADSTLRRQIKAVARKFAQGNVSLLGVIINQFDARKHKHGHDGYDGYYSSEAYYGD